MHIHAGTGTVVLEGRLDARSAPVVREVLRKAVRDARADVVVDVRDVVVKDSTGLSVLVGAARLAERKELRVCLVSPSMRLRHMLARTHMMDLFSVNDGVAQEVSMAS